MADIYCFLSEFQVKLSRYSKIWGEKMIIITDCLTNEADEGCLKVANTLTRRLKEKEPDSVIVTYHRCSDRSDLHLKHSPLFPSRKLVSLLRRNGEPILYIPFSSNTRAGVLRTYFLSRISRTQVSVLFSLRRPMGERSKRLLRESGARVISLSADSHRFFRQFIGSRAMYMKTGVDTACFTPADPGEKASLREKYRVRPGKKVLLHVGHLSEGRNVRRLLNVSQEFHVFLVVSTLTQRDEVLRAELEARPNTTIIDTYLPNIEEIYRMTDVYFFPVEEEGNCIDVPLSVLEAAACNVPVVMTRYGELKELAGTGGFYFLSSFEPERLNGLLHRAAEASIEVRPAVMGYDWSFAVERIREVCSG